MHISSFSMISHVETLLLPIIVTESLKEHSSRLNLAYFVYLLDIDFRTMNYDRLIK